MNDLTVVLIAVLLMLPGLVGVLVPVIPGLPYMFLVALGYASLGGFGRLTGIELAWLAVVVGLSLIVDYGSGLLGARWGGASPRALTAGVVGLLIGTFLLPPFGGLLGLFFAVLLVEVRSKETKQAWRAATGSLAGTLAGIVVNLILGLVFIGLFLYLVS